MARKAAVKYRSLRNNLVHLPISIYAQLTQQQSRPQSLIVHLSPVGSSSSASKESAYLGWSGLSSAVSTVSVGGVENVDIDPEVARNYHWDEGTIVEISIIHSPVKARSISVTPSSPDDWEILEQNSSFLENNLLSQIRAARKGQDVDIWVKGKTKIRIHVDETDPPCSPNSAVLINGDTEVFVAPRPRQQASSSNAHLAEKRVILPSTSGSSTQISNGNGKGKCKAVRLRLVPERVVGSWGQPRLSPEQLADIGGDKLRPIALCSGATFQWCKKRLKCSSETNAISISIAPSANLEAEEYANKVNGEEGSESKPNEIKELEATLVVWEEMPDGHVGLMRYRDKEEWLRDWDTVRVSLSTSKVRGKRKGEMPQLPDVSSSLQRPFPGTKTILNEATRYLFRAFYTPFARPLLLLGGKGSGKTSLAKAIGIRIENERDVLAETLYEDVSRIDPESRLSTIKETMTSWIEKAKERLPSLLILDNLDSLLAPDTEITSSTSGNSAILSDIFCRLFSSSNIPKGVLVLITATSTTTLQTTLGIKHIFGETIKIPPLTKEVRQELIQTMAEDQESGSTIANGLHPEAEEQELDYVALGGMTEGYSAADLGDLVNGARRQGIIRTSKCGDAKIPPSLRLTMEDFTLAQIAFTPLSLRGVSLQKSDVKWSDIGGLEEPRRVLRETLEWPTKYAQIFANCPLRLRSGLLLYGFPGCGKTLLASAVAKECGLNFISVKGPEILNKYIGASEKAVRDLFERASAAKPCVLFFDEFDSIAPKRGHDSTGVTDRVVNQMLTEMDGAQGLEGVYVLAATSRPDLIDPALLRPGRLDKSILCDMPSYQDRLDILRAVGKKLSLGMADLEEIARDTEGFSGADLQAVMYNAHLEVVHLSLASTEEQKPGMGKVNGNSQGKGKGKGKAVEYGNCDMNSIDGDGETAKKYGYVQINPVVGEGEVHSAADKAEVARRVETIINNVGRDTQVEQEASTEIIKPVIEQIHLVRALENTRPSVSLSDRRKLELVYRTFVGAREGKMENGDMGRDTGTRVSLM